MNSTSSARVPLWLTAVLATLFILTVFSLNYSNYAGAAAEGVAGIELWGMLLINSLLIAIPAGLLYFSIGLLYVAFRQHRTEGTLSPCVSKFIYRTPRIAGILITLFIAMFALDVFDSSESLGMQFIAFVIHALPAIILGILLTIAWRRPWFGFALFLAAALVFLVLVLPNPIENLGVLLLFSAPLAVIALLFYANWRWRPA